eukprot:5704646-Amphidinium_carterae.3
MECPGSPLAAFQAAFGMVENGGEQHTTAFLPSARWISAHLLQSREGTKAACSSAGRWVLSSPHGP